MKTPAVLRISGPQAFQKTIAVSRETVARLETYAALLKRWQKTINLVAPSTLDDVWHRHFADSAQLWGVESPAPRGEGGIPEGAVGELPTADNWDSPPPGLPHKGGGGVRTSPQGRGESMQHFLDLGSGAGFPGLVLAIMAAENGGTRHTLVESDTRKAAFLREVARETGVAVEILADRIESARTAASVGEVNCVTARALAPLPRLLPWAVPFFGGNTVALFLKGREVAAELEEASRSWDFRAELLVSLTDREGRVVRLTGLVQKLRPSA